MKITGSHTVEVPRERLWAALQDPAVLARTLPGCSSLEVVGDDTYAATITAGVASIRGTYTGQVQLHDKQEPDSYRLTAEGSGSPGTINADAQVRLESTGGSTTVHYDADAVVGGMIGGVGQRMIAGAARRTAGEFFDAVAADVLHGSQVAPGGPTAAALAGSELAGVGAAPSDVPGSPAAGGLAPPGAPQVGQVFPGKAATSGGWFGYSPAAGGRKDLLLAFGLGALVALIGVIVGRRTARPDSSGTRRFSAGRRGRSGRGRGRRARSAAALRERLPDTLTSADDAGPGPLRATWGYLLTIGAWKWRLARRLWSWVARQVREGRDAAARAADTVTDDATGSEHDTSPS